MTWRVAGPRLTKSPSTTSVSAGRNWRVSSSASKGRTQPWMSPMASNRRPETSPSSERWRGFDRGAAGCECIKKLSRNTSIRILGRSVRPLWRRLFESGGFAAGTKHDRESPKRSLALPSLPETSNPHGTFRSTSDSNGLTALPEWFFRPRLARIEGVNYSRARPFRL